MQQSKTFEPLLIPVDEACATLRVSRSTLYQLVKAGQIQIKKLGGKTSRVTVESLNQYVRDLPSSAGGSPIKRGTA